MVVRLIPIQVVVDLIPIPVPVGPIPIPVAVAAAKTVLARHIPAAGTHIPGRIPIPMCHTQSTAHTRTVLTEDHQAIPTHSANTATSRQIRHHTEVIWNERKQKAADLLDSRVQVLSLLSDSRVVIA